MAEGGTLPWKRQTIDVSRGPVGRYDNMSMGATVPKGMQWHCDDVNKEWKLVPVAIDNRSNNGERQTQQGKQVNFENTNAASNSVVTGLGSVVAVRKKVVVSKKQSRNSINDGGNLETSNEEEEVLVEEEEPLFVEGVDYIYHTVLPTDTLMGIGLRYKTKVSVIQRTNQFTGTNLVLAPPKLLIPLQSSETSSAIGPDGKKILLTASMIHPKQDVNSKEYKLQEISMQYPNLCTSERRAYLDMNDWDVLATIENIQEDIEWEKKEKQEKSVVMNVKYSRPNTTNCCGAADLLNCTLTELKEPLLLHDNDTQHEIS